MYRSHSIRLQTRIPNNSLPTHPVVNPPTHTGSYPYQRDFLGEVRCEGVRSRREAGKKDNQVQRRERRPGGRPQPVVLGGGRTPLNQANRRGVNGLRAWV